MNPVVKRTLHHVNFTVKSNAQAFVTCLYFHLAGRKRQKIFIVAQATGHSTKCKTDQSKTTCSVGYVNTQHASIKAIAHTDIEQVHCILVVPNKHEWCESIQEFTVNTQLDIEKWIAAQCLNRSPKERRPFAKTKSFTLLSFADDSWI